MGIYIIASIGSNFGHSLDTAKKLILSAKESGADAVKFHSLTADTLAHASPTFVNPQPSQQIAHQ